MSPRYTLTHTLDAEALAERRAELDENRARYWQYNAGFATATQLRGVDGDSPRANLPNFGYGLGFLFHQGRVTNNLRRSEQDREDETLHVEEEGGREVSPDTILMRSVTLDEAAEDAIYAMPPSDLSLESLQCVLESTAAQPCLVPEGGEMPPVSIHDYAKLFVWDSNQLPAPKHHGALLFDDAAFAHNAVAGPNPMIIRRLDAGELSELAGRGFPVTQIPPGTLFQGASPFRGQTLQGLAGSGKLFFEEYPELERARGQGDRSSAGETQEPRFVFAPRALYGVTQVNGQDTLLPIAIQCRESYGEGAYDGPIFYPHTPGSVTYESDLAFEGADYTWQIAKAIVLSANTLHHEAVSHLGRTHLLMEAVFVAAGRRLSLDHPVRGVLRPHTFGTFFINNRARVDLIATGGDVDRFLAPRLEDFSVVAAQAVRDSVLDELYVPAQLQRRGVHPSESAHPLPSYPYAEDALLMWEATRDFVAGFLGLYYRSEADLQADLSDELGGFFAELSEEQIVDGQRMPGLRFEPVTTREQLYDFVTWVAFTASSQHSAVNFAQADILGNPAWSPTAIYRPAPTGFGATRRDYLETLPPFSKAIGQVHVGYQLGGFLYRPIGDLVASQYAGGNHDEYWDILDVLRPFRSRLREIERQIEARNAGLTPERRYTYLLPSRVSQSINI